MAIIIHDFQIFQPKEHYYLLGTDFQYLQAMKFYIQKQKQYKSKILFIIFLQILHFCFRFYNIPSFENSYLVSVRSKVILSINGFH